MTIVALPFTDLALVAHSAGGAILRNSSGYIGGTLVPASVVDAFTTAAAALQGLGASTVALTANPYVVGGVVIAAVAVGAYCYFSGIPAPVAETLLHAGLGTHTDQGLMVSTPHLATALVLLGAAGYVAYRFYSNFKALWADKAVGDTWAEANETSAQDNTVSSFGSDVWATLGKAVWATKDDVAQTLATVAQDAVDRALRAADAISVGATAAYGAATSHSEKAANHGFAKLGRLTSAVSRLWRGRVRQS